MYLAKFTEEGAYRHGYPIDATIEYETIRPIGLCIINPIVNGEQTTRLMGFIGEDRSIDLITWPEDFYYEAV